MFNLIKVKGKETEAKIFTDSPQETAIEQIEELCDQDFMKGLKVRIMPDYHAGKGCVIGTTINIKDKVVPNLVGVDVGCGVLTVKFIKDDLNFESLDKVIRKYVPSGVELHTEDAVMSVVTPFPSSVSFRAEHLLNDVKSKYSLGTLGGGNHFIEVSVDYSGCYYLTIHTGSRYVGAKIAQYYQKQAVAQHNKKDVHELIDALKKQGRFSEIQVEIENFKKANPDIPKELAYLEGELFEDYIHDMKLAQQYAKANREEIARIIITQMEIEAIESFDTIHNYIDTDNMILRKGAVSAQKGEQLIIPINMRDGSIIARGKGNPEWNYSAPHGAGRVLSRTKAMQQLDIDDFRNTMKNVWTTSVNEETLDEAPMAYKTMDEIMSQIGDTVEIIKVIKPVYNFKASEKFVKKAKG